MIIQQGIVDIDGSHGEGGGQMVRMAVAFSAITGRDVRVRNIRAGRPNPGLQAQHLKGVEAVAALCGAKLQGAYKGSTELTFRPGAVTPKSMKFDIGTAGSVTLVLQALVLAAARVDGTTKIEVTGGTHVSWSPLVDYFQEIFCRHLKSLGIEVEIDLLRHGFYPKGGGTVIARIQGSRDWKPLDYVERPSPMTLRVSSIASTELKNARVAERQVDGFKSVAQLSLQTEVKYVPSHSIGSALFGLADCGRTVLGSDALGKKGVRAEDVGREAARKLQAEIDGGASLDINASDMVLPYLVLATGPSRFTVKELSGHLTSVQWLTSHFSDTEVKFEKKGTLYQISTNPMH